MKPIFTSLVFITLLFLSSCGGKTETVLTNTSPNGQAKVTVEAKRLTAFEPWQVQMKVKAYSFKEGLLKFEVYVDELNSETVTFNWVDEHNCDITFRLKDDTERHFKLIASPSQVQMAEV